MNDSSDGSFRETVARWIFFLSIGGIVVLSGLVIWMNPDQSMTVLNMLLPVFSAWVGTVIAFYFGRDNFESANKQVRDMFERLSPAERAEALITTIMRKEKEIINFVIEDGKTDADYKLQQLYGKFNSKVTRLPVVDSKKRPKYLIHDSRIAKYVEQGGKLDDNLKTFIDEESKRQREYGVNKGFIVISEACTIASAKQKIEEIPGCQDIFVTKGGSPDEPLTGWVSNTRLAKSLEA